MDSGLRFQDLSISDPRVLTHMGYVDQQNSPVLDGTAHRLTVWTESGLQICCAIFLPNQEFGSLCRHVGKPELLKRLQG